MDESVLLQTLYNSFVSYVPNLIGFFILLFLGWGIGKILGRIAEEIIKRSKIESVLFEKRPVISLSSLASIIVSWSVYLLFIKAGVDVLGIKAISDILASLLSFIPRFVAFLVVFFAGYFISEYLRVSIEKSEIEYRRLIAKIVFLLGIYVSAIIALPLVGIDVFILQLLLIIVIIFVLLPISIGFSLAIKDELKKDVKKWLKKLSKI
ncbi:MAG: mechanosensitive ion channel family protein [Candidatus Aenigmatarchaeota archaeon]|jgi:flagellar biosynthesis protein FliQ